MSQGLQYLNTAILITVLISMASHALYIYAPTCHILEVFNHTIKQSNQPSTLICSLSLPAKFIMTGNKPENGQNDPILDRSL